MPTWQTAISVFFIVLASTAAVAFAIAFCCFLYERLTWKMDKEFSSEMEGELESRRERRKLQRLARRLLMKQRSSSPSRNSRKSDDNYSEERSRLKTMAVFQLPSRHRKKSEPGLLPPPPDMLGSSDSEKRDSEKRNSEKLNSEVSKETNGNGEEAKCAKRDSKVSDAKLKFQNGGSGISGVKVVSLTGGQPPVTPDPTLPTTKLDVLKITPPKRSSAVVQNGKKKPVSSAPKPDIQPASDSHLSKTASHSSGKSGKAATSVSINSES